MRMKTYTILVLAVGLTGLPLGLVPAALAQGQAIAPLAAPPVPLPPQPHPPGDIPDTQVFIEYHSPLGFSVKVPEGWARLLNADGVTFTSTYDGLAVQLTKSAMPPSVDTVKQNQAVLLEKSPAAVRITSVAAVDLPAGRAVLISFSSNSEANAVTGKAIRLENAQYLFWKDGRLAALTLSAPLGADNVDQWQLMAQSFRW